MNKTYLKNNLRDIRKTLGKVFSIGIMVGLAAMVVLALTITGPSMRKTLNNDLKKYGHPDIIVRSTYGLMDEDELILKNDVDIEKITMVKSSDLFNGETLIRLKGYNEQIPKSVVVSGHMPQSTNEIALSSNLADSYKIGDEITFSYAENAVVNDENMANLTYKLVGFYKSSDFFMEDMRKLSATAKKELDGYAYVLDKNFDTEIFGEANITYKDSQNMDINSDAYRDFVRNKKREVENKLANRPGEVLSEIKEDAYKEISDAETELDDAKSEISEGEQKLRDARAKLDQGYKDYETNKQAFNDEIAKAKNKLEQTQQDLVRGENRLSGGKSIYDDNLNSYNARIQSARDEIATNERDLTARQSEIDKNQKDLDDGYRKLEDEFAPRFKELESAKTQLDAIQSEVARLESEIENLDDGEKAGQIEQLEIARSNYESSLAEYQRNKAALDASYNEERAKLDSKQAEINQGQNRLDQGWGELNKAKTDLSNREISGKSQLDVAKSEMDITQNQIAEGWASYHAGLHELEQKEKDGKAELQAAYQKLLDGEEEYQENYKKYNDEKFKAQDEIQDGEKELEDNKKALARLRDPSYDVESIYTNEGIKTYHQNSLNMDELTKVFPTFFYLVAMLVTLTTMKRYIEEQRTINGTLKALGYTNKQISQRFYLYGIIPTLIGSIIGAILGRFIVSKVIIDAYSSGFGILGIDYVNSIPYMIFSVALSVLLIALTVFLSSRATVRENPASLLRPKAPNIGKKILLERFTPLWKKLSFMQKITARNIFRYKSRMFMTLFGVGGCTALTFFGFAMIDSIKATVNVEQNEISHYDVIAMVDENASAEDKKSLDEKIKESKVLDISYEDLKIAFEDEDRDINLVIPKKSGGLEEFVSLRTPQNKPIDLKNEAAVISKKTAETLGIRPGDSISLTYNNKEFDLPISNIMENYTGEYIYIDPVKFEDISNIKPNFNAKYLIDDADKIIKDLEEEKAILALINTTVIYASIDVLMENLNLVIGVITLISVLLALVVLYNLININVSERKRELATIKVLGFYPKEVTGYIFREIFILTLLGIVVGYGLGYAMFRYIISVVAPEDILLYYKVNPRPFAYSGLITIAISLVLLVIVHRKLKNIDMAEAMSSGE